MSRPIAQPVVSAKWESVPKFRHGYVAGSRVAWRLTLGCGCVVTRYDNTGKLKQPKRAACRRHPQGAGATP